MSFYPSELCGVCARQSDGLGWTPHHSKPVLWLCDDPDCLSICRARYAMKQDTFTKIEADAVVGGGDLAGRYLDSIGKTDLGELSLEEWQEFCRLVVAGYRSELVRLTSTHAAPF